VGSFGNATFEWVQSDDCLSWTGFWQYPWSNKYAWHGSRVIHNECVDGTTKECTDLPAGLHHALEAVRECRFGSWQSECFITKVPSRFARPVLACTLRLTSAPATLSV